MQPWKPAPIGPFSIPFSLGLGVAYFHSIKWGSLPICLFPAVTVLQVDPAASIWPSLFPPYCPSQESSLISRAHIAFRPACSMKRLGRGPEEKTGDRIPGSFTMALPSSQVHPLTKVPGFPKVIPFPGQLLPIWVAEQSLLWALEPRIETALL